MKVLRGIGVEVACGGAPLRLTRISTASATPAKSTRTADAGGSGLIDRRRRLSLYAGNSPTLIGFMLGKGGVDSVFLVFAGVAVIGLLAATRVIETRNLRLEEISR